MHLHPLLVDLWISSLCYVVNGGPGKIPVRDKVLVRQLLARYGTPIRA